MSANEPPKSQVALLNELLEQHRISLRRLARALADSDDPKRLEKDRRNLTRWRKGKGISDANAERLVDAFRTFDVILPRDYFKRRRGPRSWQEEMEARMNEMQSEIDTLRRQLGESA